jgi:hypothetical protein
VDPRHEGSRRRRPEDHRDGPRSRTTSSSA